MLCAQDSSFYTVASKNPIATYRVLWYRSSQGDRCKVDILQPGIMDIPSIEESRIQWIHGLPVAPFSMLLLLKLQGWTDHRAAIKQYLRIKQHVDVTDINNLLPIAIKKGIRPNEDIFLPKDFIAKAQTRVNSYVLMFPNSRTKWEALGFMVSPAV